MELLDTRQRPLTVDEYHAMGEAGIRSLFLEGDKIPIPGGEEIGVDQILPLE